MLFSLDYHEVFQCGVIHLEIQVQFMHTQDEFINPLLYGLFCQPFKGYL